MPVDHSRALVAVYIGINDINDLTKVQFPLGNITDFPALYKTIIASEFQALETVYEKGFRNFLFMNLPPLDRNVTLHAYHFEKLLSNLSQPSNVAKGPAAALPNATMVHQYNTQISSAAKKFNVKHSDATVMVFDAYSYLSGILDNPNKYGITNTTNFCPRYDAPDIATNYATYGCSPTKEYFWYNSGHITWRIHELMAGALDVFLRKESSKPW